jgi:hypothetical protein
LDAASNHRQVQLTSQEDDAVHESSADLSMKAPEEKAEPFPLQEVDVAAIQPIINADPSSKAHSSKSFRFQLVGRQEVDMSAMMMTERPLGEITATKEDVSTLASDPPQYSSDPPIDMAPSPLMMVTSGDVTEGDVLDLLSQGDSTALVTSAQSNSYTLAESTDCIDRILMNVSSPDSLDLISISSPKQAKELFCLPCW